MLTIGHSNRSLDTFLHMLQAHGVELLVDVRTVPRSRHNPQFNRDTLPQALAAAGIRYEHLPGLGGLRHPRKDSANTGWKNLNFRGYADYMQTAEFTQSLEALEKLEHETPSGDYVRRISAVAVPSFADRRCLERSRRRDLSHHERDQG